MVRTFVTRTRLAACVVLCLAWACLAQGQGDVSKPITFIHVSYPYITVQGDKLPEKRKVIAQNKAVLAEAIGPINAARADFVTVAGCLTWFGSEEDYDAVKSTLASVKAPLHVIPGDADVVEGGDKRFAESFKTEPWHSFDHKGLHVVMAGVVGKNEADKFAQWLEKDLRAAEKARAVLVLSSWVPKTDGPLLDLVRSHRVAAWIGGTAHGPAVMRFKGLPVVTAPAMGWSGNFSYIQVEVRDQSITLTLVPRRGVLPQRTELANPRSAPSDASSTPYFVSRHRELSGRKPLLTFVQISDTQFDDQSDPQAGARYAKAPDIVKAAVAEINQLEPAPAMALVTGDLTNRSSPAEWELYDRIVRKGLKMPIHALPGNHDFNEPWDPKTDKDKPPPTLERFQANTGEKLFSSWEASGVKFIALNTADFRIDPEQLSWLGRQLEVAKGSPVIVLGHHPVDQKLGNPVDAGAAEAMKLLAEHKVIAYLCGHRHGWATSSAGGLLHYVCNDLCWEGDNGYVIYYLFADELRACYKPVGQDVLWELTWPVKAPRATVPASSMPR